MLEVKSYFFDDEDDLWADIHSNGRRHWDTVVGCDRNDPLYITVAGIHEKHGPNTEEALRIIEEHCRKHGHEERIAKLPRIEDTSKALQEAYKSADEWAQPFSGCGYYEDDEQFALEYGMTVDEYKKQMEADIEKYGLNEQIWERNSDDDCLYGVTWWICEDFTTKAGGK